MENNITHLFVYGSLRSGFHYPAYEYIIKYFSFIGEAKVKGLLYHTGDYPAAVPTTEVTFITGELYKAKNVDNFAWAMGQLDAYEEVDPEEGQLPLYKRELTEVVYNNTTTQAWIYWYNRSLNGQIVIPSGNVTDLIKLKNKS